MKKNIRKGLRKVSRSTKAVIQGDTVDSRFFKRHFFITAFTVITCLLFIAERFEYATAVRDIRRLEVEIGQAESAKNEQKTAYHTLTSERSLHHLVDSLGLDLHVPGDFNDRRPVVISYDSLPNAR